MNRRELLAALGPFLGISRCQGTFTDVTRQAGLREPETRWGTRCTFVDYNRDGLLDLFVSHYLIFDPTHVPRTGRHKHCNFRRRSV
jgi:hypothetical protein